MQLHGTSGAIGYYYYFDFENKKTDGPFSVKVWKGLQYVHIMEYLKESNFYLQLKLHNFFFLICYFCPSVVNFQLLLVSFFNTFSIINFFFFFHFGFNLSLYSFFGFTSLPKTKTTEDIATVFTMWQFKSRWQQSVYATQAYCTAAYLV